jgi:hypothetical protein
MIPFTRKPGFGEEAATESNGRRREEIPRPGASGDVDAAVSKILRTAELRALTAGTFPEG